MVDGLTLPSRALLPHPEGDLGDGLAAHILTAVDVGFSRPRQRPVAGLVGDLTHPAIRRGDPHEVLPARAPDVALYDTLRLGWGGAGWIGHRLQPAPGRRPASPGR